MGVGVGGWVGGCVCVCVRVCVCVCVCVFVCVYPLLLLIRLSCAGTAKKRETETKGSPHCSPISVMAPVDNHLAVESKKWVTRGEKVSTINCFVFGDRIVFDGPFEEISSRVRAPLLLLVVAS